MWGLRWGRRSKSGKIDRLPSCVGWRGRKPRAGLRHGFTPLLDGTNRAEAARLAGMERQALRDAVLRYNTEDLAGLRDRPKGRPQRRLTEGEEAALAAVILRGPEPDRDGCCAWTRGDLCRWMAAHFGKSYQPFEHDPGAAPHGVLAPEGAPGAPEARS